MPKEYHHVDLLTELGIEELPMRSFFSDMFQDTGFPIRTFMTVGA